MSGYRAVIDFGTSYTAAASRAGPQAIPAVVALADEGRLSAARAERCTRWTLSPATSAGSTPPAVTC